MKTESVAHKDKHSLPAVYSTKQN